MANLSNINDKFIVTDGGNVLIAQTNDAGFKLSVAGTVAIGADRSTYIDASEDSSATSHIFTTNAAVGDFSQLAGNLVIQARVHPSVYRDIIFAGGLNTAGPLMTILGEGKVGIGTTSPAYNLVVSNGGASGLEFAIATATGLNEMLSYNRSTSVFEKFRAQAQQFEWYTDATANALVIQSGGNVGIGTVSPSSFVSNGNKLVVGDGTVSQGITIYTSDSGNGTLYFADGTTGDEAYRGFVRYSHSLDSMLFYTAGANERMRIDSSGNVGIGVTPWVSTLPNTVIDVNPVASIWGYANSIYLNSNAYFNNGWLYKSTAPAGVLQVDGDILRFRAAASGTADAGIAFDVPFIVDSGGNVGIGVTGPGTTLQVSGFNLTNNVAQWIGGGWVGNDLYHREGAILGISGTNAAQTSAGIAFQTRNTGNSNYWKSSILMNRGGELEFYTGGAGTAQGTRRLLIQSSGAMYIDSNFQIGSDGNNDGLKLYGGTSAGIIYSFRTASTPGSVFRWYTGGVLVGSVSTTTSSTSFNTSSDYRLKENVIKMTGALDRVSQLKPSRFNFIADSNTTVDGFLAHEVQEIVPEAITGEKDAIDKDGNPDYQGIDQSKLVPLLVAAIQELKAEIELLKSK